MMSLSIEIYNQDTAVYRYKVSSLTVITLRARAPSLKHKCLFVRTETEAKPIIHSNTNYEDFYTSKTFVFAV